MIRDLNMIILILISLFGCGSYDAPTAINTIINHDIWNVELKKFVDERGWVNYKAWQKDREGLNAYLKLLSDNRPDNDLWTKDEKLAYWINAYNAFTIDLILSNYPLKSITDLHPTLYVPGLNTVWHKKFFNIGKTPISLDEIEHKILRVEFEEPRIHFAIVCASFSCPKLRNEAYVAARIRKQLQQQAIAFINDPNRNQIGEKEIRISKIFKWFKGDFTKNGGLADFLNQYARVRINKNARISYLNYNWALNGD